MLKASISLVLCPWGSHPVLITQIALGKACIVTAEHKTVPTEHLGSSLNPQEWEIQRRVPQLRPCDKVLQDTRYDKYPISCKTQLLKIKFQREEERQKNPTPFAW